MHTKKGRFISFEGIEGVGKTTAIQYVRSLLDEKKVSYVVTREPGGTPIAEAIRDVLLSHYSEKMCADTELLLMFAGRAQNIAQVILPALKKGLWVLSDRFTDASFAYQGGGRGIDESHIAELAQWVQGDLRPDLTILLDASAAVGLKRVTSRGAKDRIEVEGAAFFDRVRQTYLKLARQEPNRFTVIDADQPLEAIKKQLKNSTQQLLES